jgi:hypothetical protein
MNQRGGHGDALAHALGVFGDDFAVGLELEEIHQASCALDGDGPRQAVHAAHKFQKFRAGEPVEQQRFVGDQADAALDFKILFGQTIAQQFDRAAIVRDESGENADGGGFARAIGSEKAEEGPARHFQVDAIHRRLGSIVFSEAADQDGRRRGGGFCEHAYEYKGLRARARISSITAVLALA